MKLALFFTFGVSLKSWHDQGLIIRDSALYNELAKDLEHIYFFTYGDKEDLQFKEYLADNITIIPMPFSPKSKFFRLIYGLLLPFIYYKTLRKVDVIKSHQMWGGMVALWAKMIIWKKYVARCGFIPSRTTYPRKTLIRKIMVSLNEMIITKFANVICVPSEGEAQYFKKRYGVSRKKISINPNWIDAERFCSFGKETNNNFKICFLARFEPRKQPLLLIEAVKDLEKVELLMIGWGSLDKEIRKKIKEYNLKGEVISGVENEKLPKLLNSCNLYVILSLWEGGSPKTLLEAMACEIPSIGINVDGVNEVIDHKENGLLCDNNLESVKNSITSIIDNKELREKIGKNGRETVLKRFSLKNSLKKELKLYHELTK